MTAEALAEMFHVSPRTIRADAEVARAVEIITRECGAEARQIILSRDSPLRRATLLNLAGLPAAQLKPMVAKWVIEGRV